MLFVVFNHKLLFKINTMINTVYGTSIPAENCTGSASQARPIVGASVRQKALLANSELELCTGHNTFHHLRERRTFTFMRKTPPA